MTYTLMVINMNSIDPNKYRDIINKNNNTNKISKKGKNLFIKIFIVLILFLSIGIICKSNEELKDKVYNYVYKENISFTKIKKFYNKYLGGILPLKKEANVEKVFNEKLKYNDSSKYYDGVKLAVGDNYLVPSLEEGMVVFIGDKENYGNTVIIEDLNGVYMWYGNIDSTSLKLYDYVEKGTFVGEVNNDLYMVFSQNDDFLNYEEYIN